MPQQIMLLFRFPGTSERGRHSSGSFVSRDADDIVRQLSSSQTGEPSLVKPCEGWSIESIDTPLRPVLPPANGTPYELFDASADFYHNHFFEQEHKNYVAADDAMGFILVSHRRRPYPTNQQAFEHLVVVRSTNVSSSCKLSLALIFSTNDGNV
jgi:hypothetical protein